MNGSGHEAVQNTCTYMYIPCLCAVSSPSTMTNQERDEIDSAAQDFIHSYSNKIENLHHRGP